jgi:hypothetical protein
MVEILNGKGKHVAGLTNGQTIYILQNDRKLKAKVKVDEHQCIGVTEKNIFYLRYDEVKNYFICDKISIL